MLLANGGSALRCKLYERRRADAGNRVDVHICNKFVLMKFLTMSPFKRDCFS